MITLNGILIIKLQSINDIKHFVETANKCPTKVTIQGNHVTVDAKSLMGIFTLDMDKPLRLEIYNSTPIYEEMFTPWVVG